jgi:hypothetical protein
MRGGPKGPHDGNGVERAVDERAGIDRTKGGLDNRQEIGAEVG